MISKATPAFWRLYHALPDNVRRQTRDAYRMFDQNPYHPGLRFKCVHPSQPIYSARVDRQHRAVGVLRGTTITQGTTIIWFWIGKHDEYMKLLASIP